MPHCLLTDEISCETGTFQLIFCIKIFVNHFGKVLSLNENEVSIDGTFTFTLPPYHLQFKDPNLFNGNE